MLRKTSIHTLIENPSAKWSYVDDLLWSFAADNILEFNSYKNGNFHVFFTKYSEGGYMLDQMRFIGNADEVLRFISYLGLTEDKINDTSIINRCIEYPHCQDQLDFEPIHLCFRCKCWGRSIKWDNGYGDIRVQIAAKPIY